MREAIILIAKDFYPDNDQLNHLLQFSQQGNDVFIIAKSFSSPAEKMFNFSLTTDMQDYYSGYIKDSLAVKLKDGLFKTTQLFTYPGKRYEGYFDYFDSAHCTVLGTNEENRPNFIQYKTGNGNIFIHVAPLAFSNYFILHKQNKKYFQNVMSVIPAGVGTVHWSEYFLNRQNGSAQEASWLKVLFRYPSFKWGLMVAIVLLGLYVLVEMRRKERIIVPYKKPLNDSLDFVKTLGRLYYERQDHKNLSNKLTLYFLEHIRSAYRLNTQILDQDFIENLAYKSGYPLIELSALIARIKYFNGKGVISEKELIGYYNDLELFYQNS
ncbi:MAG: hypothetical protein NVS9B7_22300 [Flavisolibacter sp.]